jgi:hypothetical protein
MSKSSGSANTIPLEMRACWSSTQVGRAIQNTADLSREGRHYFLASHAPIDGIVDERTKETIGEAKYFDLVFRSAHRNVQAIVYGEPGTGKSHLIHWLKLRCDELLSVEGDLRDITCILIERRNGSFKDALEQIVEQLGSSFSSYLEKIHTAIRQISSETARKSLAGEFRLELSSRRADRGLPLLSGDLRHLSECFVAPGFGDWLTRGDGAIARLVSRLTEASTVEERLSMPLFSEADFLPTGDQRQNPPIVRELIDQFAEDDELCRQACAFANEVSRNAVLGMTGLSASDLQNVFFDIRRDLARQNKRLVLLVEDVSVYASLDRELVIAFEPQKREGLCDLKVVFGMTGSGLNEIKSLPDNQIQRITYIHSVSRAETKWGDNGIELARFTARYLNSVRLDEAKVRELAILRSDGSDVNVSACDSCPLGVTKECHETFGSVELAPGTHVGLFPFTPTAPARWFEVQRLRGQSEISQTPRSLLMQFVFRGLEFPDTLPGQFPPASIPIPPTALPYWTAFLQQYCGGWSSEERSRLQRLASVWVNASNAKEAAQAIEVLREPLAFPIFSSAVITEKATTESSSTPAAVPIPPKVSKTSETLLQQLGNIQEWSEGKPLLLDTTPRDLLFALIKTSIAWPDVRQLPARERARLLKNKEGILIEGQRAAASGAVITFPRSDETADLLRALLHFEYMGSKSWAFDEGERYKRIVAAWLRRNQDRVIACLIPNVPDFELPVQVASHTLAVLFMASQRKRLPVDRFGDLIENLFSSFDTKGVTRVSPVGNQLFARLSEKQLQVREWLAHELSSPQGDVTTCVFIDPRPILRFFRASDDISVIKRLDDAYARDIAATRYAPLAALPALDSLEESERAALTDLRNAVISFLGGDENMDDALNAYIKELLAIKSIQERKEINIVFPDTEFDQVWRERLFQTRLDTWDAELRRSHKVLSAKSIVELIVYTPEVLQELKRALVAAEHYLDGLEAELRLRIQAATEDGDPDQFGTSLTTTLSEIVSLTEVEGRNE